MAELMNILTFDDEKVEDVLDIPNDYQQVAMLTTGDNEAGQYMIGMSWTANLASANKSMFYRWRLDGGVWIEFIFEPSDSTNDQPFVYFFPKDLLAGVHTLEMEARKEDADTGQFDIHYLDLYIQRIG